ncbi:DUF4954 family protein [bacterium]|nr:DUF4954 family protein [bacterium]
MNFSKLNNDEIELLEKKGCSSGNWDNVFAGKDFSPHFIENVKFIGNVIISGFTKELTSQGEKTGIYNTCLSDCETGLNVSINSTGIIKNYIIEDEAVITGTNEISADKDSGFGNGVKVDVLNEAGGRTVPIFDRLNSQIAYMLVFYRYRTDFIDKILKLVNNYIHKKIEVKGRIGKRSIITGCGIIRNVCVGDYAVIEGALELENGTIASEESASSKIGIGVICRDFIVLSGSKVESGAILESCFVGQSVTIGKQYSAENSLIFANSELFHGEGCSVFAGPYTVSHHKSTLLIAGFFSFYNAGSGTNQSNHMYKLGPVHQGVLERGSKTGSFSYMMWPSQTGPFTNVIGKHYTHFDTSDLPFSIITEEEGKSILSPAMNLFTVGTKRDSQKWPDRDKRKGEDKLDMIHFKLFSPFIIQKVVKGIRILKDLQETSKKGQEFVHFNGTNIRRLLLRPSIKYYEMAVKIFTGQVVAEYILSEQNKQKSIKAVFKDMNLKNEENQTWFDIGGMFAKKERMDELIRSVEAGTVKDIAELNAGLRKVYENYNNDELLWCLNLIKEIKSVEADSLSIEQIKDIIDEWKENAVKLNNMILRDAEKEYDKASAISYGRDGIKDDKDNDFKSVRGLFEDNSFVNAVKKESIDIENLHKRAIDILNERWE